MQSLCLKVMFHFIVNRLYFLIIVIKTETCLPLMRQFLFKSNTILLCIVRNLVTKCDNKYSKFVLLFYVQNTWQPEIMSGMPASKNFIKITSFFFNFFENKIFSSDELKGYGMSNNVQLFPLIGVFSPENLRVANCRTVFKSESEKY